MCEWHRAKVRNSRESGHGHGQGTQAKNNINSNVAVIDGGQLPG